MTDPELCSFPALPHILPFFSAGPLSIVVIQHGSGAPAHRTGVVLPHVFHQTMHAKSMFTHGGSRPHHRLQTDRTLVGRFEGGRRSVARVHIIHQRLIKRHLSIQGLGAVFVPSI
ncbi:hypothetical protein NPIL_397931 [Nephila pilipes]|uniref:Uncharacterized protein n=1 Tax=Nephila pilipes TaxID=299642 RepID=A0A8X6N683_NEPPI|nr:hypothetical protein NPIL_397931 [Nephila pilipes]